MLSASMIRANNNPSNTPVPESGKGLEGNPEEEFFRLLVLSIKILLWEKDPEFGVEVNQKKLLKQAKLEKVPFHKWFFWIDKRLK
jgi:hypothetical protein